MYNAQYVSHKGDIVNLGIPYGIAFDVQGIGGIAVNMGMSQAYSQIGETVITQSVGGSPLVIKGVIFRNIVQIKNILRKIFAPFTVGDLIVEGYKIRVHTKISPIFNMKKDDGRFTIQLYAPVPFFKTINELVVSNRQIRKLFSFPINHANTHRFGEETISLYVRATNNGDVKTPFRAEFETDTTVYQVGLVNVVNQKELTFNVELASEDKLIVYRDDDGFLHAEKITEDITTDILPFMTDSSNLFELDVGENILSATSGVVATLYYNEMVGAIYEH